MFVAMVGTYEIHHYNYPLSWTAYILYHYQHHHRPYIVISLISLLPTTLSCITSQVTVPMYMMLSTNYGVCSTDRATLSYFNNSGPHSHCWQHKPPCAVGCYDTNTGKTLAHTKLRMLGVEAAKKLPTAHYCGMQSKKPVNIIIILLLHLKFGSTFAIYSFHSSFPSLNISPLLIYI